MTQLDLTLDLAQPVTRETPAVYRAVLTLRAHRMAVRRAGRLHALTVTVAARGRAPSQSTKFLTSRQLFAIARALKRAATVAATVEADPT